MSALTERSAHVTAHAEVESSSAQVVCGARATIAQSQRSAERERMKTVMDKPTKGVAGVWRAKSASARPNAVRGASGVSVVSLEDVPPCDHALSSVATQVIRWTKTVMVCSMKDVRTVKRESVGHVRPSAGSVKRYVGRAHGATVALESRVTRFATTSTMIVIR